MPVATSEIRTSLDHVIEDIEKNQQFYGNFSNSLTVLAQTTKQLSSVVEDGFADVDQRFERVDQRFEQVDQRFEQVDQRFDRIEHRLEQFEANTQTQFGLVTDHLRKLDARMERLVGYIIRDELKEPGDQQPASGDGRAAGAARKGR